MRLAALVVLACAIPAHAEDRLKITPFTFAKVDAGVACDHRWRDCAEVADARVGTGLALGDTGLSFSYSYAQDLYPDRPPGSHYVGVRWSWGRKYPGE